MVDVSQRRRSPDGRFADEYNTPTVPQSGMSQLASQISVIQQKAQQGEYDSEIEGTLAQYCPDVEWNQIKNNPEALQACRSMVASRISMLTMDDDNSEFSAPAPALTEPVSWSDFDSKHQVFEDSSLTAEQWAHNSNVATAENLYDNTVSVTYTDEFARERKKNHMLQGFTLTQQGNESGEDALAYGHAHDVRDQLETYGRARVFQPLDDSMTLVGEFTLDREDPNALPVFHEEKIVKHALR